MSARTISLADLIAMFPTVDQGMVEAVHASTDGIMRDCIEQLEPFVTDDGSGSGGMSRAATTDGAAFADVDYDAALATGEDKRRLEYEAATAALMQAKMVDIQRTVQEDRNFDAFAAAQRKLGPQSLRSNAGLISGQSKTEHTGRCFHQMIERERELCGEFVCFYHSYSFAALIYELQACIARIVYGLPEDLAPMPRLLKGPFKGKPHVQALLKSFSQMTGRDHDPRFREVAISVSNSLHSPSSEAPPMCVFVEGYSCTDLSFREVLMNVLNKIGVTSGKDQLCDDIANAGYAHGLSGNFEVASATPYSGGSPGHMLQIFVRVDCVDDVAYGSHALGVYNPPANPMSQYLTGTSVPDGQARVFWHPSLFFDAKATRVYHYAANKFTSDERLNLQRKLNDLLRPHLSHPVNMLRAMKAIEGEDV